MSPLPKFSYFPSSLKYEFFQVLHNMVPIDISKQCSSFNTSLPTLTLKLTGRIMFHSNQGLILLYTFTCILVQDTTVL